MDENRVPRVTLAYRVTAWVVAALIGSAVGTGLGLLTREVWTGIVTGAIVAGLVGLSIVLAARRQGHGAVAAAPPWAGDAGVRHDGGSL